MQRRNLLALGGAAATASLLAACGQAKPPFKSIDITGADYAKDFQLTDHLGQARSLKDFRGQVVVVFFGFTQCPDVCPTALMELSQVKGQLGADGQKLQGIFITVDPERDTPELLKGYVPNFGPGIIGLTGTPKQIADVAKAYRVYYQKVPGKDGSPYLMDHSSIVYLLDRNGRFVTHFTHDAKAETIANAVGRLL